MMPKGHLAESEAKGYADGITGVMKSRSLDPDEKDTCHTMSLMMKPGTVINMDREMDTVNS